MPGLVERLVCLTPSHMEAYRSWTDAYESAWAESPQTPPDPNEFVPDQEPPGRLVLVQNLKVALEYLCRRGTVIDPEEFLSRFPRLVDDESRVDVLAWGSRLADAAPGSCIESFSLPSLTERFPDLRDAIVDRRTSLYREQGGAFPPELVPEGTRLLQEMPRGGMSRLALIWNEHVQREEVLKLIDPVGRDDPEAMERFRREIRLAGDRAGTRVVPVLSAGVVLGHLYYTMPHLRGGSLRDRLRSGGFPLSDGIRVVAGIARCVHALHTQKPQIVHRDLKPENVLFTGPGFDEPWIADLGLARLIVDTSDPGLTERTNHGLGTPGYMAPEQVRDPHSSGPAADVHALGAVVYELLTGFPPFFDAQRHVAIQRTLEQTPLSPRGVTTRQVPVDLEVIALKALRKDPADRFHTALELAEDLERWLAKKPILSRPPSAWSRVRSIVRRHPRTSLAAAASLLALLSLSILSFALFLEERTQRRRADRTSRRVVSTLHNQAELLTSERGSPAKSLTRDRAELLRDLARTLEFVVQENQGDGSFELGTALSGLAMIDESLSHIPEALRASREAERIFAALPPTLEARFSLASAQLKTGRLLFSSGKPAEGEASTREAAEALRALAAEDPANLPVRSRLAIAESNLGNFTRQDRPEEAESHYRRALEQWEFLCEPGRMEPHHLEWLARTSSNLGLLIAERGSFEEAIPLLTRAVERSQNLLELAPDQQSSMDSLANNKLNLGDALIAAGRLPEASTALESALAAYQDLAKRFPDQTAGPWGVALVQTSLAEIHGRLGRWNEAVPLLESAGATYDVLLKIRPHDADLRGGAEKQRGLLSRAKRQVVAPR